jgi:23S rRNA U2552 (ribose-2'-O)-methylase RlmE/FtsJ
MGANGRPGASLRVWRDYFPNARIYGSDIDQNILFEEHRIKTYFVDQRNPNAIQSMWQKIGEHDFDLMIDDGLHAFDAGRTLFENSISKIASTGIYIIEDVMPGDQTNYMRYFEKTDYRVDFVNLNRPYAPLENNSLVVVRKR